MYSMLFGMIHLFVGLGIKGYMCLKEKKILDFFCDVVLWFMLLIGLILMLLPSEIFSSISQIQIVFPDAVNLVAKGLVIAGAVGILLMSGRDKKIQRCVLRLVLMICTTLPDGSVMCCPIPVCWRWDWQQE